MSPDAAQPWVVVMPVKRSTSAKSRLRPLSDGQRADLALAFATDTASAAHEAAAVGAVLVVTDDAVAAERLGRVGCSTVPDLPGAGLNAAVQYGVDRARERWPGCWAAVLPSDLPALRPDDLDAALAAARGHSRAFVPDAAEVGTNLLTAAPQAVLAPRFEGASSAAHAASGAVRLDLALPRLRYDVDDVVALDRARSLGLGPATLAALSRLGDAAGPYDGRMQATVASYDDQTRSGTVLCDDGVVLPFASDALEGSRVRFLRPGQRVRITFGPDGQINHVQIVTLAG